LRILVFANPARPLFRHPVLYNMIASGTQAL
jgi:hypothetical protein